jgi:hypothetical protein
MSTITTINAGDTITSSRTVINTNFSNLNTDKIETSVIDTDTALTANSDAKVPSQKAIKAYVDAIGNITTGLQIGTINAGATINGATLPVPVYQNTTDNEVYACDGNDLTALKFMGFAVSNGTNGNSIDVKVSGIVSGFTGLDEGVSYWLSDTAGTIQNTPGTYPVLVGIAISTTQLVIQKGGRTMNGTISLTSGSSSTAITTGFRPKSVSVYGTIAGNATTQTNSKGGWSAGGGNYCVYNGDDGAPGNIGGVDTGNALFLRQDTTPAVGYSATIASITNTGFTFTLTVSSTPGAGYVYWEAEGEF